MSLFSEHSGSNLQCTHRCKGTEGYTLRTFCVQHLKTVCSREISYISTSSSSCKFRLFYSDDRQIIQIWCSEISSCAAGFVSCAALAFSFAHSGSHRKRGLLWPASRTTWHAWWPSVRWKKPRQQVRVCFCFCLSLEERTVILMVLSARTWGLTQHCHRETVYQMARLKDLTPKHNDSKKLKGKVHPKHLLNSAIINSTSCQWKSKIKFRRPQTFQEFEYNISAFT